MKFHGDETGSSAPHFFSASSAAILRPPVQQENWLVVRIMRMIYGHGKLRVFMVCEESEGGCRGGEE